ncbi:30S ribosomal protein S8 [Candidatus Berkelbacteria bacterium]|nr:30S ribosomal protein S8 [Candidatus Berkelbacteria bacterium]MBI2588154.1 30S ribosomal protein S8 [Candidatus Berkelbacteria bacterium]MBI4029969.1 30S ribosomal protein S8 [Candidatus Berkelbacteria bacterium]
MDKVADMLISIKNAVRAGKEKIEAPHSNFKEAIAKVLVQEGYLKKQEVKPARFKNGRILELTLGKIQDVKLKSTPGRSVWAKAKDNLRSKTGVGSTLLSTSKGVLFAKEAKKQGVGGKIIAEIY